MSWLLQLWHLAKTLRSLGMLSWLLFILFFLGTQFVLIVAIVELLSSESMGFERVLIRNAMSLQRIVIWSKVIIKITMCVTWFLSGNYVVKTIHTVQMVHIINVDHWIVCDSMYVQLFISSVIWTSVNCRLFIVVYWIIGVCSSSAWAKVPIIIEFLVIYVIFIRILIRVFSVFWEPIIVVIFFYMLLDTPLSWSFMVHNIQMRPGINLTIWIRQRNSSSVSIQVFQEGVCTIGNMIHLSW